MESKIAAEWLQNFARTANEHDFAAHMNLISRKVQLFGVPGFDVIGYDDWSRQCEHEFAERVLQRVAYEGLDVVTMTPLKIMFKTFERVEANDGTVNASGVEMLIQKELDDTWRLVQERVLPDEEVEFDRNKRMPG